jgi:TPR repeat protein
MEHHAVAGATRHISSDSPIYVMMMGRFSGSSPERLEMTILRTIFLTMALMLALGENAHADAFDDEYAALKRQDYVTALRLFRRLAEQGNVAAQFNLGLMYLQGQGGEVVPRGP